MNTLLNKLALTTIFTSLLIYLSLSFSSCKEVDELTHFYFSIVTDTDIPATETIGVPLEIVLTGIPTNSSEAFVLNNTTKSLVEKITVSELFLNLPDSGSQTFDFLSSVEIYIFTDSLPEILLGKNTSIPETGLKSVELENDEDDLKDYLIENTLNFKVLFTLRDDITEDTNIEMESTFFVDAELLGI